MSAVDYEAATKVVATRVPLAGTSAEASWDANLTERMKRLDVSVAEEALFVSVLAGLERGASSAKP